MFSEQGQGKNKQMFVVKVSPGELVFRTLHPEKIHQPQAGLNLKTLGLMESMFLREQFGEPASYK